MKHKIFRKRVTNIPAISALLVICAVFINGCGEDAFLTDRETLLANTGSGGSSGGGDGSFEVRTDFSGIYGGRVGPSDTDPTTYGSYARLFIASNGSGFAYNSITEEQAWPNTATEEFVALSFGTNQISTQNLSFNMDAYGFSYSSETNSPEPRDAGTANFSGLINTSTSLENYASIAGSSVTGPGNIGVMADTFNFARVTHDEDIDLNISLLVDYSPWLFVFQDTYGFPINHVNIGRRWELTFDSNGGFTAAITEGASPSGCVVTNGQLSLIDTTKNEFTISFDLACSDTQVNGGYTGIGHVATNPYVTPVYYFMIFAVQMDSDSTKYLTFFD